MVFGSYVSQFKTKANFIGLVIRSSTLAGMKPLFVLWETLTVNKFDLTTLNF